MLKSLCCSYRSLTLLSVRNYARGSRFSQSRKAIVKRHMDVPDSGITGQVQILRRSGIKEENIDMEMLEESESNFYNIDETYDDHERESKQHKDLVRLRTVKQKYFDSPSPNLLTWSEKEQIRHLNGKYPGEWTPEKLSESFPATEETIKKLLKYAWKPASENRIERHDASALRNWRELQEGTLEGISPALRERFLTFTNRNISPRITKAQSEPQEPKTIGEFESIVNTSVPEEQTTANLLLHKLEKKNTNIDPTNITRDQLENIDSNRKRKKYITMTDLQNEIGEKIKLGKTVEPMDRHFHETMSKSDSAETVPNVPQSVLMKFPAETSISSVETNKGTVLKSNRHGQDEEDHYPEYITIPKESYKENNTYKVKDCYYDHDGEFLYRVPGMTN